MKKLVTLMLALAMIISAVGVLAEADGKITIWTWDPTFNIKAMQIAKEMYLKDHPDAVIDIQEKLSEDIETAVIASNGDTSTLPDILLVQDNSFQKFVTNYPEVYADLTASTITRALLRANSRIPSWTARTTASRLTPAPPSPLTAPITSRPPATPPPT